MDLDGRIGRRSQREGSWLVPAGAAQSAPDRDSCEAILQPVTAKEKCHANLPGLRVGLRTCGSRGVGRPHASRVEQRLRGVLLGVPAPGGDGQLPAARPLRPALPAAMHHPLRAALLLPAGDDLPAAHLLRASHDVQDQLLLRAGDELSLQLLLRPLHLPVPSGGHARDVLQAAVAVLPRDELPAALLLPAGDAVPAGVLLSAGDELLRDDAGRAGDDSAARRVGDARPRRRRRRR